VLQVPGDAAARAGNQQRWLPCLSFLK
jgi:hypothetical protein